MTIEKFEELFSKIEADQPVTFHLIGGPPISAGAGGPLCEYKDGLISVKSGAVLTIYFEPEDIASIHIVTPKKKKE